MRQTLLGSTIGCVYSSAKFTFVGIRRRRQSAPGCSGVGIFGVRLVARHQQAAERVTVLMFRRRVRAQRRHGRVGDRVAGRLRRLRSGEWRRSSGVRRIGSRRGAMRLPTGSADMRQTQLHCTQRRHVHRSD